MTRKALFSGKRDDKLGRQLRDSGRSSNIDRLDNYKPCTTNAKTSTTPESILLSEMKTKTISHVENDKSKMENEIRFHNNYAMSRPRSCPNFDHCDVSENANFSQGSHKTNYLTFGNEAMEKTFWHSLDNNTLQKVSVPLGGRDENFDIISHNDIQNYISYSGCDGRRQSENVCDIIEVSSLLPEGLMPYPPVWTSLAMKDRMAYKPYPDRQYEFGLATDISPAGISQNSSSNNHDILDVNSNVKHNKTMCCEGNNDILCDNDSQDLSTKTNGSIRLTFYQEININGKVGDEPIRFLLTKDVGCNVVHSQCESECRTKDMTLSVSGDKLSLHSMLYSTIDTFFRDDNEDNEIDNGWDCVFDGRKSREVLSTRCNEESWDCSTEEEFANYDSHLDDVTQDLFSLRPGNPVAQVLEFGDNEHLLPILQEGRPKSTRKDYKQKRKSGCD